MTTKQGFVVPAGGGTRFDMGAPGRHIIPVKSHRAAVPYRIVQVSSFGLGSSRPGRSLSASRNCALVTVT
jgi:hypothetical protein